MKWKCRHHTLDLSRRAAVMGVLNVTPDSFSDGGRYLDPEIAVQRGLEMAAEGAGLIDVGGESTRPGAAPVPEDEELRRVVPVIRALRRHSGCLLSVDTSKAAVAEAALEAGAAVINDVTGLTGDPRMAAVAARTGAGVVLMHMRGTPRTMQEDPRYGDVVREVTAYLRERLAAAEAAGIDPQALAIDPGIGFGKSVPHNLALLRRLGELTALGRPVLVGVSRKSFLGRVLETDALADREWATVGLTSYAVERGARVVRVHTVRPNVEAARMTEAILGTGAAAGEP